MDWLHKGAVLGALMMIAINTGVISLHLSTIAAQERTCHQ